MGPQRKCDCLFAAVASKRKELLSVRSRHRRLDIANAFNRYCQDSCLHLDADFYDVQVALQSSTGGTQAFIIGSGCDDSENCDDLASTRDCKSGGGCSSRVIPTLDV